MMSFCCPLQTLLNELLSKEPFNFLFPQVSPLYINQKTVLNTM